MSPATQLSVPVQRGGLHARLQDSQGKKLQDMNDPIANLSAILSSGEFPPNKF